MVVVASRAREKKTTEKESKSAKVGPSPDGASALTQSLGGAVSDSLAQVVKLPLNKLSRPSKVPRQCPSSQ